jgi:uncharacterized protein YjbI with pentapeptide repeats
VLTGVDTAGARMTGANLAGALRDVPVGEGARDDLLAKAMAHQEWCKTSGRSGGPAIFNNVDLRPLGAALKGMQLTALSAKGACCVGMDLSGCELQGANFEGADLRGANLNTADLRGARLCSANLTKTSLRKALLSRLPLGGGRSTPTNGTGARLRYAKANDADCTGMVFDGADLHGASFDGALIESASWRGALIEGAGGLEIGKAA